MTEATMQLLRISGSSRISSYLGKPSEAPTPFSFRQLLRHAAAVNPPTQSVSLSNVKTTALQVPRNVHHRRPTGTKVPAVGTAVEVSCSSQSLAGKFAELKKRGEVAVIPFLVAGDPDLGTTEEALLVLDQSGADIIELGVPYSDPLADGPVIQAAATRALAKGTDLNSVLSLLERVSPKLSAPVVLFTYYNPIMKRGPQKFFQDAKAAGAAGLVIPDIPLEETPPLRQLATENGLELVLLTTPTTPVKRMAAIAEAAQGFLYLVSLTGVTGARAEVESRVERLLKEIKQATDMPVAVGFGISTAEHATQVAKWGADGVIVGSKVVSLLANAPTTQDGLAELSALVRSLKDAVTTDLQKV